MSKRAPRLLLEDMVLASEKITTYTSTTNTNNTKTYTSTTNTNNTKNYS
mgnify:CR=1 FL=1